MKHMITDLFALQILLIYNTIQTIKSQKLWCKSYIQLGTNVNASDYLSQYIKNIVY